jgi:hypothetical protein
MPLYVLASLSTSSVGWPSSRSTYTCSTSVGAHA